MRANIGDVIKWNFNDDDKFVALDYLAEVLSINELEEYYCVYVVYEKYGHIAERIPFDDVIAVYSEVGHE